MYPNGPRLNDPSEEHPSEDSSGSVLFFRHCSTGEESQREAQSTAEPGPRQHVEAVITDSPVMADRVTDRAHPTPPPIHLACRLDGSRVDGSRVDGARVKKLSSPEQGKKNAQPSQSVGGSGDTGKRQRNPDPLIQSIMLLTTMAVMLAAARFAVPSIVEEIRYSWHRGELRAEFETGHEGLRNVSLETLSQAYQMVTAAVSPSVVHIEVERRPSAQQASIAKFIHSEKMTVSDQGSGVIVDEAGYLLTNSHVIADGEEIKVTLSDGRRVPARLVGSDPLTDLAVLKIDADRLLPVAWGDSERCRVGSPVWAVGSPFGLDRTVTFGIISGKHRMVRASTQYQDFMQSDVAVNPGNSGGPLVDARGMLVGINTAIVGDTFQGVSFSIPSNVARQVYERLKATGKVERGWLGVRLEDVADGDLIGENPRVRGAKVDAVTDHRSPAALAGLRHGDVILRIDGKPINDVGHLMRLVGDSIADTVVQLEIYRDSEFQTLPVRLGLRPDF